MALVPGVSEGALMELDVGNSAESLTALLNSQRELFHSQIEQLQKLVVAQCKLTGVNPLSQEMAAGALSIKIGKKPRDLLNPKAVNYMQSIFSVKDTVGKKETREISALCGVTVTQWHSHPDSGAIWIHKEELCHIDPDLLEDHLNFSLESSSFQSGRNDGNQKNSYLFRIP